MRLIDADALLKEMDYHFRHLGRAQEVRDMINSLPTIESPRDWTPCAEGLPTNSARYKVTLQVGSEAGTWLETAIIPYRYCDGVGEWILPKSDWLIYGVIAWTKADEPWTGGLDGK